MWLVKFFLLAVPSQTEAAKNFYQPLYFLFQLKPTIPLIKSRLHITRGQLFHNLIGAAVDLLHARVSIQSSNRILHHIAITAE